MNSNQQLLQMLVEDNDSRFLREFGRRLPTVHQEAKGRSIDDEIVDVALKSYCFGQTRYTLAQSLFLSVGRECGHAARIDFCETNGFPIPVVTIGRFQFTLHHGFSGDENRAVNSSQIRKQHSAINGEILQPSFDFGCTVNASKLQEAELIVANIIYGCRAGTRDFENQLVLAITMPYRKKVGDDYKLFNGPTYDYADVLRRVQEREKAETDHKRIINVAVPKLKKSQD